MNAPPPDNTRPTALLALLGAVAVTVTATIATIDQWPAAPALLRTIAATTWVIYALLACTDRILTAINRLHDHIEQHGDERHTQGVLEGIAGATTPQPPTQLRRR